MTPQSLQHNILCAKNRNALADGTGTRILKCSPSPSSPTGIQHAGIPLHSPLRDLILKIPAHHHAYAFANGLVYHSVIISQLKSQDHDLFVIDSRVVTAVFS
nr:hypothetical protein Iba_chr08fCG3300 [Ipomoea batatas]